MSSAHALAHGSFQEATASRKAVRASSERARAARRWAAAFDGGWPRRLSAMHRSSPTPRSTSAVSSSWRSRRFVALCPSSDSRVRVLVRSSSGRAMVPRHSGPALSSRRRTAAQTAARPGCWRDSGIERCVTATIALWPERAAGGDPGTDQRSGGPLQQRRLLDAGALALVGFDGDAVAPGGREETDGVAVGLGEAMVPQQFGEVVPG